MGTKLGKIQSGSKPTVQITGDEYALIKAIWTRIEFEPKVHGTGFYLRYFSKYPQYIKYFLADPIKDDVNPDALMVVKFTVIIEVIGYLILDFHNKPKQFDQMIGYIGMMHKDMDLELEDTNNFFTALVDYLKDVMSDLMTEACEVVFVSYFQNIQELMMKSMEEERQRFPDEDEDDVAVHSHFKALLPCTWFDNSNKLIYGQPREYWVLRQQDWESKIKSWEDAMQLIPAPMNVPNTESTSSEDEALDTFKIQEDSDLETHSSYPDDRSRATSFVLQRAKYLNTGRLVSVPHFDHHDPESSDFAEANEIEESHLINDSEERSAANVRLTPRERHRAEVAAIKSLHPRPSGRLISSTDTGSPRYSDGSSARERRRSTWN